MKRLLTFMVLALLAWNTWSGVTKIAVFRHRFSGERALARAEVDSALASLRAAAWWAPGDSTTYLFIGQVVQQAQANGLPLKALEGRGTLEVFGFGLAAVGRGIALNPADAWAWFNVATLHQSARKAGERMEKLKRAGEAALQGGTAEATPPPAPDGGLDGVDFISLAAAHKAMELEPDFYFYHDFLADIFWKRGMKDRAAAAIRAGLALTPSLHAHVILDNREFLKELAEPILEGLEESAANRYVERVLHLRARAEILQRLSRLDEAARAYEQMRELEGRELRQECDVGLARILQAQGRWRESLEPLRRAREAGPETVWGVRALFHEGEAHARTGSHDEARRIFESYLVRAPESVAGYDALAASLVALGRPADAEKILIAAVRRFPKMPHLYENVIAHMRAHGKSREALLYAHALRKVGSDSDRADSLIREIEAEARAGTP